MNPRLHTQMMQANNADIARHAESRRRHAMPAISRNDAAATPRRGRLQLRIARLRGASAA
jgi:hypothetical protein